MTVLRRTSGKHFVVKYLNSIGLVFLFRGTLFGIERPSTYAVTDFVIVEGVC